MLLYVTRNSPSQHVSDEDGGEENNNQYLNTRSSPQLREQRS
jgi:hypothetical protein